MPVEPYEDTYNINADAIEAAFDKTDSKNGINSKNSTFDAIQHVLEQANIEFIPENRGGVGVRCKKKRWKMWH